MIKPEDHLKGVPYTCLHDLTPKETFHLLLARFRQDLMWDEFQKEFYELKVKNPQKVGKEVAQERAALYGKNVEHYRETVKLFIEYGRRHKFF